VTGSGRHFHTICSLVLLYGSLPALRGADPSAAIKDTAPAETEELLSKPGLIYLEAKEAAQAEYRKAIAATLEKADKVEMYILDFEMEKEPNSDFLFWENRLPKEYFPITPYKYKSRILVRKALSPEERQKLIPPLQDSLKLADTNGVLCHYPIHGIRAWKGEEILFQSSLCWKCGNFGIDYPDGAEFARIGESKLKEVCDELLPIPQKEIERFTLQGFGSKKKKAEEEKPRTSGKKSKPKK